MPQVSQDIIVDAEFASLIPPLSAEERQQLEDNIVEHGGARDPLVVWVHEQFTPDDCDTPVLFDECVEEVVVENKKTRSWDYKTTDGFDEIIRDDEWPRTLLDGHNRYEICTRLGLPFEVHEIRFASREDAADWMDRNQLGRRNLHPDAFTLLLGRRYNRAKRQGERTDLTSDKSCQKSTTAERIAKEHGVHANTVRNAGKVAEAIDKLKAVDPAIESKMVRGKAPARAAVVKAAALLEKSPERAREIIEEGKQMAEVLREEKKAEKERIKLEAIEKLSESEAESFGITHCSLTEWDAPQCQLVFTDPPYHDKHVDRFRELGQFAMQHLDEGRFLCTYTGKLRLADCVNAVLESGMEWVWIFSVYHPFSKEKHLGGVYNIAENWRPVVVFRKPGPVWTPTFQQDVVRGERSKSHHDWSQDEQTPEQLIQAYSVPGEIVLDPFCGGGTTPLVAKRVGRRCFACDVDIAAVAMATDRLRGNQGR